MKCLLGVRINSSISLCLAESGKSPARFIIRQRLKSFLERKMSHRDMEEPFQIAYEMCRNANSPGFIFLQDSSIRNDNEESLKNVVLSIRNRQDATKFVTYRN